MKYVNSGEGKLPLISMLAILSISLIVNLPGLAISPIQGKLVEVFPHATSLQIQLLEVLPNFVVIPFILLAGKICNRRNQIAVLAAGLGIFALTGILYLLADTLTELILLGCVLGVGCGLVIPLAASLISQYFAGAERAKALGWKSGLSNVTVIFATIFVGWMAEFSWHLSFLVYLLPLIPLALIPFMTARFINKNRVSSPATPGNAPADTNPTPVKAPLAKASKQTFKRLFGIMGLYILTTYATIIVCYYLPFDMKSFGYSTGKVGVATAMYYLAASCAGFGLTYIKRIFGAATLQAAITICMIGLYATALLHSDLSFIICTFVVGFGYGIIQPVIYEKTTQIAPNREASTRYFAYLLTGNYIGIACVPFIVTGMAKLFHANPDHNFSFLLNGSLVAILLLLALWKHRSFIFHVGSSTPAKTEKSDSK